MHEAGSGEHIDFHTKHLLTQAKVLTKHISNTHEVTTKREKTKREKKLWVWMKKHMEYLYVSLAQPDKDLNVILEYERNERAKINDTHSILNYYSFWLF
jgi:hypothetical protein